MSKQRQCHICGTTCESWCPACEAAFLNRPPALVMTADERVAEMRLLNGPIEIPFSLIHQRIEELVGRPVWTHELGLNWDGLVTEAETREHPTFAEVCALVPEEKLIVATRAEGEGHQP